jgi:hypothetical protein
MGMTKKNNYSYTENLFDWKEEIIFGFLKLKTKISEGKDIRNR